MRLCLNHLEYSLAAQAIRTQVLAVAGLTPEVPASLGTESFDETMPLLSQHEEHMCGGPPLGRADVSKL